MTSRWCFLTYLLQTLSVEDVLTGCSVQLSLDEEATQMSHQPPTKKKRKEKIKGSLQTIKLKLLSTICPIIQVHIQSIIVTEHERERSHVAIATGTQSNVRDKGYSEIVSSCYSGRVDPTTKQDERHQYVVHVALVAR